MVTLINDEERARRIALLKTGALSDLTLRVGDVTLMLHKAVVALRCTFLWRSLDPSGGWAPSEGTNEIKILKLPMALEDTDGAWQPRADLETFFEWVYLAEAPALPVALSDADVRRLFRLHRLAVLLFGAQSIACVIEEHITGAVLPAIAAAMGAVKDEKDTEALRRVLFAPLNVLLAACLADPDGRFQLGRAIVQWALSVAPTFFPLSEAEALRREIVAELHGLVPFFPSPNVTPFADPAATVAAICERCFMPHHNVEQQAPPKEEEEEEEEVTDRGRLPGARDWILLRQRKHGTALMCPNGRDLGAISVQFLNVAQGRLTRAQVLHRVPFTGWRSAVGWFRIPPETSAAATSSQELGPRGQGRCQQCRRLTRDLLVLAIRPYPQTLGQENIARIG
jgi:hypothetical protein